MNAPQAYATYANIPPEMVLSASVTVTGSITPSTIQLVCAPLSSPPAQRGTFTMYYGSRRITFPECRFAEIAQDTGTDGRRVSVVTLLDRRWKWKFGRVRGVYNWWVGNNEAWATNRKTPEELLKILFKAMNETRFRLINVPNKTYPYVDWDETPATAFGSLCDILGCRISYDPITDFVTVAPVGHGAQLPPIEADGLADNVKFDPPEVPDEIRFMGGKTQVEWDIPLEPVGEGEDGEILALEKLPYKPANGWSKEDPEGLFNVEEKHRKLARKCIWRYYRPKLPIKITSPVNEPAEIGILERMLPLNTVRVEVTPKTPFRAEEPKPAVVWGTWYDQNPSDLNGDPDKRPDVIDTAKGKKIIYSGGFSIDSERGLVIFSEPVYQYVNANGQPPRNFADPAATLIGPAWIYLRVAVSFRDSETFAWHRREEVFTDPPQGRAKKIPKLIQYVERDDIAAKAYVDFSANPPAWKTNKTEFREQASFYVRQAVEKYFIQTPGSRSYAGLVPISPDAAITQVSWVISEDGTAATTAARNVETSTNVPTYEQKRRDERARHFENLIAQFDGKKEAPAVANFMPGKKP